MGEGVGWVLMGGNDVKSGSRSGAAGQKRNVMSSSGVSPTGTLRTEDVLLVDSAAGCVGGEEKPALGVL